MSLIMVQENEFLAKHAGVWVIRITVSFHTHEHTDVKYNISVYLYISSCFDSTCSQCYQHCEDNHRGEEDARVFVGVG